MDRGREDGRGRGGAEHGEGGGCMTVRTMPSHKSLYMSKTSLSEGTKAKLSSLAKEMTIWNVMT